MLWVGDKGCEIYSKWELHVGAKEVKKLNTHYIKYKEYVKPTYKSISSTRKFSKRMTHLSNFSIS